MDLRFSARLVLLGAMVLAGCTGSEGDACQEPDDCNDGLVCCKLGSIGLSNRGTCQSSCTPSVRDSGVGPTDGGPDGGPPTCDMDTPCESASHFCNAASCFGPGICEPIPSDCEETLAPVCSCAGFDGVAPPEDAGAEAARLAPATYQNECFARLSRRRIAFAGTCDGTAIDAGTDAGTDAGAPDAGPDAGPDGG